MFPPSVPLTFGSVVVRRFIDSYTGYIPAAAAHSTGYTGAVASSMVVFSGLLCWLYRHLKNGTLVRIGVGHKYPSFTPDSSRNTIHRRPKNDSWFLRNARACRSRCTDAVYRLAKNSYDSLHKLHHGGILKHKIKMPHVYNNHNVSFKRNADDQGDASAPSENCKLLYNNDEFDNCSSSQDVPAPGHSGDKGIIPPVEPYRPPVTRRSGLEKASERRKSSERIKKKNSQKITRKTRSGRVYAYRL